MKHEELIDFIKDKMSMAHIYQPLLIKELVKCDGAATVRQLAISMLVMDESRIQEYKKIFKRWPEQTLKKHGVLERNKELVSLTTEPMTLEQKSEILQVCEQKIHEYVRKRGEGIWDPFESSPLTKNQRYEVLKRANKRCELCGVKEGDKAYEERLPLHVDHIIPDSKGGATDLANLQALCRKCNQGKGNRDDTDFRIVDTSPE